MRREGEAMSILGAFIVPIPLIIPDIGGGEEERFKNS